ncbi:MAG: hypothetical protein IKO46_03060 [Salinivirgaceae bacterium]|nr:hypothetical protein [Salinivirgaceae bacterium]
MKRIIYLLFLNILSSTITINAQCLIHYDTITNKYYNGITEEREIIDKYQITNNSDENYLTWVALEPINDRTDIELVHDYFKKRKGDFNLVEMMFENLLDSLPINIGYSFIKNIAPKESFSYYISKKNMASNFYRERIVLIKRKEVEQYLKMEIDTKYIYQYSNIFLIEK